MTEQEAVGLGKNLYGNITNNANNIIKTKDFIEFVNMAIKALEKQIPKKPIPSYGINNTINSYKCPTCDNNYLGGGEYRYDCCEDCGQKLDWSDEE